MRVLYINAIESPVSGEILKAGTLKGLRSATILNSAEELEFVSYDIFYGRTQPAGALGRFAHSRHFDAVILSGSERNTSNASDPWLAEYFRGLKDLLSLDSDPSQWMGPQFPILGICFGHQALACLLGGETAPFKYRADVLQISPLAAAREHAVFRSLLTKYPKLDVVVTHGDHVVRSPAGFRVSFSSDYCLNQGMIHDQWPIVTLQSHPEITSALKTDQAEAEDWKHVEPSQMDNHHGPSILGKFLDWAATQ